MLLTYSIQRMNPRDPEPGKRWVQTAHNLPVETSSGLKRQNLRDHMTDLELIFSMLGEANTTEITKGDNAQGLEENKHAARKVARLLNHCGIRLSLDPDLRRGDGLLVEPLWH